MFIEDVSAYYRNHNEHKDHLRICDIEDISFSYFESIKKNLPNGASMVQHSFRSENIVVISYEWGNPKKISFVKFDFLVYKRDKLIEDLLDSF